MLSSNGIIRNIDCLGRIVIPMEMRRKHRLSDGDPVEIIDIGNQLVLRKYSEIHPYEEKTREILKKLSIILRHPVILCDTANVLLSVNMEKFRNCHISDEMYQAITDNKEFGKPIVVDGESTRALAIKTICSDSKVLGALIVPDIGKEITPSQNDCLKLCAETIGVISI